jgi:hypothetical protein
VLARRCRRFDLAHMHRVRCGEDNGIDGGIRQGGIIIRDITTSGRTDLRSTVCGRFNDKQDVQLVVSRKTADDMLAPPAVTCHRNIYHRALLSFPITAFGIVMYRPRYGFVQVNAVDLRSQ